MPDDTKKIDLSEHTLDVNRRRYSVDKLDLDEIDEYIRALAGSRGYEYNAIRDILIYLWGGSYDSIQDLAEENWKNKEVIRDRFHGNEDRFLNSLPLPNKLSGVCHMATGTGKSFVIFAVAYLSILLGKVDRVLVLTPSSTIIKSGLRDKFQELLFGERGLKLNEELPTEYKNQTVNLIKRNDPPEDNSIMIENIDGVYQYFRDKDHNSIAQYFASADGEVLVLSDEVHHAYSRLDFQNSGVGIDGEVKDVSSNKQQEVRWMSFLREAEHENINRHIGFTGTPYNDDDFFTDVVFNYSIKRGIDERYIKEIDPLIEYEEEINEKQRYEQIIQTHEENKNKYQYESDGERQVKPITVFISKNQTTAQSNKEDFALVLADYLRENVEKYQDEPRSVVEKAAYQKTLCVVSDTKDDVIDEFNNIEETNPKKVGGQVEYVFSVRMLTEGWDADNVFQIVPMQERAFQSKLLISQVLGRGLRLPEDSVSKGDIMQNYPMLTVTNHESFSSHIEELLNQVTQSELRFTSQVFEDESHERYQHHFNLFNINYIPDSEVVEKDEEEVKQQSIPENLNLEPQEESRDVRVEYQRGDRTFSVSNEFYTLDQVVSEVSQRFDSAKREAQSLDFADESRLDNLPGGEEIKQTIKQAMKDAGIEGNKLSKENKKNIDLFYNQQLPQGDSKRVPKDVEGDMYGVTTENMNNSSTSAGSLDNHASIFVSEEYESELSNQNLSIIDELKERAENQNTGDKQDASLFDKNYDYDENYIRQLIDGKQIFAVNQSMFKTPQGLVDVSYAPERKFVFRLVEKAKLLDSWIKSPDKGFYSLKYTFWKKGKDRTNRSFNPDFFIKINIKDYISQVDSEEGKTQLRELENKGIEDIILVTEIKSNEEMNESVANAKKKYGQEHFTTLSERLQEENPMNFDERFRDSSDQLYKFFLLHPEDYTTWFTRLKNGTLFGESD